MSTPFDPSRGLVVVHAQLAGPRSSRTIRLALDTGATTTTIRTGVLINLGCDPAASTDQVAMTTASSVENVHRVPLERFEALGESRESFPVVAHTLPPSATVDGLLGLDFFRGRRLLLDFRQGLLEIE